MASVVFFRAVNVGGHQKFQPSVLAKKLADYGVVNIGAAGTFVVREKVKSAELCDGILRWLPFKPELMICPARDVHALMSLGWFNGDPTGKDERRFVSVMQKAPHRSPKLPIEQPVGNQWEVRVIAMSGKFVLSLLRPGQKRLYPNAVVERHLGIPATTRNWNTITAICEVLKG